MSSEVLIDGLLVHLVVPQPQVLTQVVTTKEAVVSAVQVALHARKQPGGPRDAACPWEGRRRPFSCGTGGHRLWKMIYRVNK